MSMAMPEPPAGARLFQGLVDDPRVGEALLFPPDPGAPEIELQARWFSGEFGRRFTSTSGQSVEIVQFGEWNHAAGPDFVNAAVRVGGGEPLAGAIELDSAADDWDQHGHATNPGYDQVVLHLFFRQPAGRFFTRTSDHREVPQVQLDLAAISGRPPVATPAAVRGRCAAVLAALADDRLDELIHSAAWFRLHRKAGRLARACDAHGADQAVYQALAQALGYAGNSLPFLLLAQKLPLKTLRKSSERIEARLFGASGFLERIAAGTAPASDSDYLKSLWRVWWKARGSEPRTVVDGSLWNLAGARPANHPQRRLAALAEIARNWRKLRSALDAGGAAAACAELAAFDHPFWSRHYTLTSKPSPAPLALLGENRILDIQTNVLLPFLHLHGRDVAGGFLRGRAPLINRHVKTAARRVLADRPDAAQRHMQTIAGQQGLLEIYRSHCQRDLSDCLQCPFPEKLESGWTA